jgi:flagellar protein FlaG
MDIKPVGNNSPLQGQRISDSGNFSVDVPSTRQPASPVQTVNAVKQIEEIPDLNKLNDAVKIINATINALSPNLEFTVDSDTERTVVKVIDKQTNEVIRQLPTPEALEIAKAVDRLQGLLIRQKA